MTTRFLILVTLLSLVASCNDDEELPLNFRNAIQYRGEIQNLRLGELYDIGPDSLSYNWNIDLYYAGTGLFALDLDFNVPPGEPLLEGTYEFSDRRRPFTLVESTFVWPATEERDEETLSLTGGTATVELDGDVTTIDFELTAENDQTVRGNWRGVLLE